MGLSKIKRIEKLKSEGKTDEEIQKILDDMLYNKRLKNKNCLLYWLSKGYSEEEAKLNVVKTQRERSKRCVEYWIKKGYSEEEAKKQVSQIQKERSHKRNHKPIEYLRKVSPRCKEYWIGKGYSEEESQKLLRDFMFKASKDGFINQFGYEEGTKKYKEHCDRMSYVNSFQYYLDKYKDENLAIEKFKHKMGVKQNRYSKISQELFWDIYNNIDHTDKIYFGELNQEFGKSDILNKRYYWYDFVDNTKKKCIEFNGIYYHAKPDKYNENDYINIHNTKILVKDIWLYEEQKLDLLKKLGYDIKVIWEDDYRKDKNKILEECIAWLNK